MNATVNARASGRAIGKLELVSAFTFFLFIIYQLVFFLNLPARISGLGIIRPTLLLFAIIGFLLILQREKFSYKFNQPIFKTFHTFLVVILITLPFVKFPGSVLRENISLFLKAFVFLYFAALILDSERRFKIALFVFVACQVFRVLEPLYMNLTSGYWGSSTYLGGGEFASRLGGAPADIINPNELGFVLVTAIPFLHYFLMPRGLIVKLFYLTLLVLMLYALILTMSRGAFLALLVVGWFIFKESKRKVILIGVACLGVVAAFSVMNDTQRERYLSLVSSDTSQSATAEGRLTGMVSEFTLAMERPIFGFGLGTTAEAKFNTRGRSKASHNMYAEILIELGVVGFIFFARFIFAIRSQLSDGLKRADLSDDFYSTLFKVLNIIFWMFALYSVNYWGLSQYYWYNLAGLVIAATLLMNAKINKEGKA